MVLNSNLLPPSIVLDNKKMPSLDGFRGIAIIIVVIHHAFNNPIHLFSGNFGVSIFFVISGFLITTLLLKEQYENGRISLTNFYIRRFLRIFPVAYLYLLVLVLLNFIFYLKIPLSSFISSALYIRNVNLSGAPDTEWYTGHYWSLSVEEQFYLIFPFILTKGIKKFIWISISLIIIIPIANYLLVHRYLDGGVLMLIAQLVRHLSGILIGSVMAIFFFHRKINGNFLNARYRSAASLMLFLTAAFINSKWLISLPASCSQVLIGLLILINLEAYPGIVFKMLNEKILMQIGILSYSIYIWQEIFTNLIPWNGLFPASGSSWLNLCFLAVVSLLSYYFYELKFLKLKNKFK